MKLTLFAALVCATAPALAVPVSVTVVGPDNQPLPGAKLSSFETTFVLDEPTAMREQSGAGGLFAWEWDGDFSEKRVIGEQPFLRVRVAAPGMATHFQVISQQKTTIALLPARVWSGIVVDKDKKPVAGVTLKLGTVVTPNHKSELANGSSSTFIAAEGNIAVTDAQGRWSLAGLPAQGSARITLDDPRFVKATFVRDIGEGDAEPIPVRPGATVTGVLLASDGTPVVGETVRADFGMGVQTTTDEAGRFTLSGLAPGEIKPYIGQMAFVTNRKKELPRYVYERPTPVKAEGGKTTDMGALKALNGLLIKARVVGADTKKPLDDARFRIGYNDVISVVDADGTLQSRVVPSDKEERFDRPKIESKGYIDFDLPFNALKTKEAVLDLGTIEMKRGNTIKGIVRIEGAEGQVRAPGISFSRENKYDFVSVDAEGKFESKTLEAGSYSVNLNGGGGNWQIVSPRQVTLPEFGKESKPIEVVVKRLTPVLPAIKQARGRITDENGRGVAGVAVQARMPLENGSAYTKTATTDAEGAFVLDGDERVVGVEISSAGHPGYLISGKAIVEVADGIATISGLSAKKRGAVYSGHVVDSQGNPAVQAWVVVVEARDYEPVQTDKDGNFALPDVPLDKFTLLAARDRDWAKQAVQSDKPGVTLRLQTSENAVDRAQALDALVAIKEGVSSDALFAAWDILGAEGVERYLRRNGEPRPEVMALFGAELARRDSAQLIKRAPEMLDNSTGEIRENLEAQLNLVRAAGDDAGARTDANAWLDDQKQIKREINPRSVKQLLQMTAVADKLKREDAAQWLDYAAAVAAQLKGKAEDNAFQWSGVLSRLSYDDVAHFIEGRGAADEFQIMAYVTPIWAKSGDLQSAQSGLARLETLLVAPEIVQLAEQASKQRRIPPAGTVEAARSAIAVALAPTDAQGAWAMAQEVKDTYRRLRTMVRVADGAQRAGNADIAEKALRDVMNTQTGNIEYYALAASIGARLSPQLGEEFFALAKKAALPADRDGGFGTSIGMWAFYHAPFDAAQSRVLLEREWDWRLPAAIKAKNDSFSRDFSALPDLVKGMAAVDLQRAREMQAAVDAIETKNYGRGMSQFSLALLQLATPEQRAGLGVDLSMNY